EGARLAAGGGTSLSDALSSGRIRGALIMLEDPFSDPEAVDIFGDLETLVGVAAFLTRTAGAAGVHACRNGGNHCAIRRQTPRGGEGLPATGRPHNGRTDPESRGRNRSQDPVGTRGCSPRGTFPIAGDFACGRRQ